MTEPIQSVNVYLEIGKKRTFACAIEWPGWARSGPDEDSALQALFDYGERYKKAIGDRRLGFALSKDVSAFRVTERVEGNATTDFGAPGIALVSDAAAINAAELKRIEALLKACWRAFDESLEEASGKELRKGPRGGGRTVDRIVRHLLESDQAYLAQIGGRLRKTQSDTRTSELAQTRAAVHETLASVAPIGVPPPGPRGGARWPARYFVRRIAWHALDHAWEIEDRLIGQS